MSNTLKVKVNNTIDFEISTDAISKLDVVNHSTDKFHILKDNKSYDAGVLSADFNRKKYEIKVNNSKYTVDISDALDVLINDMGFSIGAGKQVNSIKAPMPGLILDINAKIGNEVKEGDTLLVLEAMKMENSIASPREGTIKSISVDKGDVVEKNQLLVEFE